MDCFWRAQIVEDERRVLELLSGNDDGLRIWCWEACWVEEWLGLKRWTWGGNGEVGGP